MAKLKVGDRARTTGKVSHAYEEGNKSYLANVPRRSDGSFPTMYCDAPPGVNGLYAVYHEPRHAAGLEVVITQVSRAAHGHPDTYAIYYIKDEEAQYEAWYDDNELERTE